MSRQSDRFRETTDDADSTWYASVSSADYDDGDSACDADDSYMKRLFSGIAQHLNESVRFSADELRTLANISAWARWFVVAASFALIGFHDDYTDTQLIVMMTGVGIEIVVNAVFHYAVWKRKRLRWQWLLAMAILDIALATLMIGVRGGIDSYYFVVYFPILAVFSVIFTSLRLVAMLTALIIVAYVLTTLLVGDGIQTELAEHRDLYIRLVFLLPVVVSVNAVAKFERSGRRDALQREQALLNDRLELSQTIHDTAAQAAYMIGLGVNEAIRIAGTSNTELNRTLEATSSLTKSVMWELRQPIDAGALFEGASLSRVLRAHILTFNSVTSMTTDLEIEGDEPPLPVDVRTRLFSIAHNSLANALRHSSADEVRVQLQFSNGAIRLSVNDDGVGLPDDYESRGRGFTNMQRDAELIGGELQVESSSNGTSVTCTVAREPAWPTDGNTY
ncbi:MAG: ATP-binding protein [Chloroflexota bacterium]|nr:ATP-binding protein [Chloroflexota bacterium]MDE2894710.1 ATP-binding protein [Chloroflexota bacterium]